MQNPQKLLPLSALGHEERLPPPRLSGCCRWGQQTFASTHGNGRDAPTPDLHVLPSERERWVKRDGLTGREFRRLRVGCQQFRETRGIAARHAAFGGYAVDPDMALSGGEAS